MMFTSSMRLLAAVAFSTDADAIAGELLRLGAMESVSVHNLTGDWTDRVAKPAANVDQTRLRDLRKRAESFMAMAVPALEPPELKPGLMDLSGEQLVKKIEQELDVMAVDIKSLRERQKKLSGRDS